MARFGASQIYDSEVRGKFHAELFLRVFGTVESSSSPLHFTRFAGKLSKEAGFRTALDAGCGKGKYSFWLAQEYPSSIVDACDLSVEKIDYCRMVQSRLGVGNINFFV